MNKTNNQINDSKRIFTPKEITTLSAKLFFNSEHAKYLIIEPHDVDIFIDAFYEKNTDPLLIPYFTFDDYQEGGISYEFNKHSNIYLSRHSYVMIDIGITNHNKYHYYFFSYGFESIAPSLPQININFETTDLDLFLYSFFDQYNKFNEIFHFIDKPPNLLT